MVIDNFDPNHPARKLFSCKDSDLTTYFRTLITRDVDRFLCAAYVAYDDKREEILGYFTLSQYSLKNDGADKRHKGGYDQIPVTLLGRFAVNEKHEGHGYGTKMLRTVFEKHVLIAKQIGSASLVIEPLSDSIGWYRRFPIITEQKTKEDGVILVARTIALMRF